MRAWTEVALEPWKPFDSLCARLIPSPLGDCSPCLVVLECSTIALVRRPLCAGTGFEPAKASRKE